MTDKIMFLVLFHCCLLASLASLTTADIGVVRHVLKRETNDCWNELTARQHTASFTSPGFPSNYPNNADCNWRITTSPGNRIAISFVSFEVEYIQSCRYDHLTIYDGPDRTFPQAARYCGQDLPTDFTSSQSVVLITFHTDSSDTRRGFEIEFREITNVEDTVGEWSDVTYGCIGGTGDKNVDTVHSGNTIELYGNAVQTEGVRLCQTIEVTGCHQEWHNARRGNITSPGYPHPYPSNAKCTIVINAPPRHGITLTFHSFDLESYFCVFDYVLIKDSISADAEPLAKLCGSDLPGEIQSTTGVLVVKFVSDATGEKGGFHASFVSHVVRPKLLLEALIVSTENYEPEVVTTYPVTDQHSDQDGALAFVKKPFNLTDVQLGDPVRQECSVNRDDAVVKWFRGNAELPEGEYTQGVIIAKVPRGSMLIIVRVEEEHEGIFVCQAQLPGQPPILAPLVLQKTSLLAVTEEPFAVSYASTTDVNGLDERFETVPQDASVIDGAYHVFECSYPGSLYIIWQKDGQTLFTNERIFKVFPDNLMISDTRVTDSGRYFCVAYDENDVKLGTVFAQLTVLSSLDVSDGCGLVRAKEAINSSRSDRYRIVAGKTAKKGSSPWIARLWDRRLDRHFCGGSLINYRWVLTSAICVDNPFVQAEDIRVRLGDHDSFHKEPSEMMFRVSRIVVHNNFNKTSYDNDIALIELDPRVQEFTDYVSPICLPKRRLSKRLLMPGKYARIAGWGALAEMLPYHRYLRDVRVPIRPERDCQESGGSMFTTNMFCAGYRQAGHGDACRGDSGGPFAMKKGDKWHLLGVISWGEGCARAEKYGFYTKVSNYFSWITEVMTAGVGDESSVSESESSLSEFESSVSE